MLSKTISNPGGQITEKYRQDTWARTGSSLVRMQELRLMVQVLATRLHPIERIKNPEYTHFKMDYFLTTPTEEFDEKCLHCLHVLESNFCLLHPQLDLLFLKPRGFLKIIPFFLSLHLPVSHYICYLLFFSR